MEERKNKEGQKDTKKERKKGDLGEELRREDVHIGRMMKYWE